MRHPDGKGLDLRTTSSMRDLCFSNTVRVQLVLLVILLAVLYFPVFSALLGRWWWDDDYSHGFLVPLISGYFVWARRSRLMGVQLNRSLSGGIPLLMLAGFMLVLGRLGSIIMLQQISLIVMIAGLVLLLMGRASLKVLMLPIAYLAFMIPIIGEVGDGLHWQLQLLTASIGVAVLQSLGFPIFHEAQYIVLPRTTLEVAEVCSGVRYLISVVAIGIPLAYFTQRSWPRRVGLIGFGVAIAILANGLRVALIGIWAYHDGETHGPFHIFQGMFVAWVGFVTLLVGAWFLGRDRKNIQLVTISSQSRPNLEINSTVKASGGPPRIRGNHWDLSWLAAILFLLAVGSYYYFYEITPVPLEKHLKTLPKATGSWVGEEADLSEYPFRIEGPQEEMLRIYRDEAGRTTNLYIGYFDSQKQGRELINFRSRRFHQGAERLRIPSASNDLYHVNRVIIRAQGESYAVLFWYDLNGRIVADPYVAKLITIVDALSYGRTNGALVLISSQLPPLANDRAVLNLHLDLTRTLIPVLRLHLPSRDERRQDHTRQEAVISQAL